MHLLTAVRSVPNALHVCLQWIFPLLGLPAVIASVLLLLMFRRLNPEREFIVQIHKSAYQHMAKQ